MSNDHNTIKVAGLPDLRGASVYSTRDKRSLYRYITMMYDHGKMVAFSRSSSNNEAHKHESLWLSHKEKEIPLIYRVGVFISPI